MNWFDEKASWVPNSTISVVWIYAAPAYTKKSLKSISGAHEEHRILWSSESRELTNLKQIPKRKKWGRAREYERVEQQYD